MFTIRNMDIVERIFFAFEEKYPGLGDKDLAVGIDCSPPKINGWRGGRTNPQLGDLEKLSTYLGRSIEWLVTGQESTAKGLAQAGYTFIPELINLTCDTAYSSSTDNLSYKTDFILDQGWDPEKLSQIRIVDMTMESTLFVGDTVLIDMRDDIPFIPGMIYAVGVGNTVLVRRIIEDPHRGTVTLIADNGRICPPRALTEEEDKNTRIIGKLVAKWSNRFEPTT